MKACRTFNLHWLQNGIPRVASTGPLAVALVTLACSFAMAEPTGERRPNIVLIISDDQTYTDLGFMGSRFAETPHLDRLAAQSARYVNGEELVSSIDIVPTQLAATGLQDKTAEMPGINLLEHATGNKRLEQGRAVCGDIYPGDATSLENPAQDIAYRWVRQGHIKLIVPHNHHRRPPWGGYLERESLYDVAADPNEQKNLIDDTTYAEQIAALRQLLDAWWTPEIDGAKQKPIRR